MVNLKVRPKNRLPNGLIVYSKRKADSDLMGVDEVDIYKINVLIIIENLKLICYKLR